jgi:hypothetical protein
VTGTQGNWQLTVNGSPYQVKGVTYGPPTAAAEAYMTDLHSMGVNTVRTWGNTSHFRQKEGKRRQESSNSGILPERKKQKNKQGAF